MKNVVGAVLAGGEGRRFKPFTDLIPKPMIPVGRDEKPLLEYIIRWFSKHGVRDLVLLAGYKWRQIANYFGDGGRWGVRIRYSLDDGEHKGTGGALLKAYKKGLLQDTALIWYGDILAPLNINRLIQHHRSTGADATIVLADKYKVPVGVAEVDEDGRIRRLEEKPLLPVKVTIGILALNTHHLGEAGEKLGKHFDIMGDLIPWMLRENKHVRAYIHRGPWYDVGSLERYAKLNHQEISEFLETGEEDKNHP